MSAAPSVEIISGNAETNLGKSQNVGQLRQDSDAAAFLRVVRSRRAMRYFDPEPIPNGVMRDCLDAALLAPNASNLQPWEFYWVRTKEMREKLNGCCAHFPAISTAAEVVVCVGRPDHWRRNWRRIVKLMKQEGVALPFPFENYYSTMVPLNYTVGPFGIIGALKGLLLQGMRAVKATPQPKLSASDMKEWASISVALACENFMLALKAHGFDSCPTNADDPMRVKRLLRLPSKASIVMVIGAGKAASRNVAFGPRLRFDSVEVIKVV